MPSRSLLSFYRPYLRTTLRSEPLNRSQDPRHTPNPAPRSGLLLSTGLQSSPRELASGETESSAAKPLSAPLQFPPLGSSTETDADYALPFDALNSTSREETSADEALSAHGIVEGDFPALPSAGELARIREKIVDEISAALGSYVEEQAAQPLTVVGDERGPSPMKNLLSHFGLREQPFDVTPDPAYLHPNSSHRAALAALKQGIDYFRGFMMLVAEPGMGKTTLLNRLMEELANSARVVFLFQTQCTSRELLCYILNELEVDHAGMDSVAMHRALNQALLEEMLRGRRFVLIVDEAQNLEAPVLETIRLLSDFETTHSKLIQIVLAGQPQLADTLMKPGLVQLRQRIAVLSSLKPLGAAEIAEYVDHRLRVSGRSGDALFTPEAIAQLSEASGGVPRSINNLCFGALLEAYERGVEIVGAEIVKEIANRLDLASIVRSAETEKSPHESAAPEKISDPAVAPDPKPGAVLTGTLTEKVRSQGWSKRPEYRILVTLERDPLTGLPVADRYYCCSMYVDETNAGALQTGKPVRIKIEQD